VGQSAGFDRESDVGVGSGWPVCAEFERERESRDGWSSWTSDLLVSRYSEGERASSASARALDFQSVERGGFVKWGKF
jgi:hypothetical protein